MNVVFFGSSKYVIPILEVLRKNFDLCLVLTTENPAMPAGRPKSNLALQGDALQSYPIVEYCIKNKIQYLSVFNLSDQNLKSYLSPTGEISNLKSPIAVLADFGLIMSPEILNVFPKGIINIHPSLLPKYRGPTPVQTAILNGDRTTGVSIMKLDDQIDHGPILKQEREEVLDIDTAESLYKRLFAKGANLLSETLNYYLNGNLKPFAQNDKEATFTNPLTRQDGYVEMSNVTCPQRGKCQMSNAKLERMIRAYFPWPGVWTQLRINDKLLRIKFLPNQKLQVEGKKPMSYKDFLNGYPNAEETVRLLKT